MSSQLERAAKLATDWWAERLMQGDKEKFKLSLFPAILKELEQHGSCNTECDYDPFGILLDAVHAADIECSGNFFSSRGILPTKHCLNIFPDHLEPKEGYGNWTPDISVLDHD